MNFKSPVAILAALFFAVIFLNACAATRELPDPKASIPSDSEYRNPTYGFRFFHAKMLTLDVSDKGYDGIGLKLLYPGSGAQVFSLDVMPASFNDAKIRATAAPGTGENIMVAGVSAYAFDTNDGIRKTLVKNEGWLYVFEGKSDTFHRVLDSFSFKMSGQ